MMQTMKSEFVDSAFQSDIDLIEARLEQVRQALARRDSIDLSWLENEVAKICQQIHTVPKDKGREFLRTLSEIVQKLDQLEAELKTAIDVPTHE